MPRISINKKQYKVNDIGAWVVGKLFKERKTEANLAEELNISQQAVSYKIHNNSFGYSDLLTIFEFLNVPDEEILQVMRL